MKTEAFDKAKAKIDAELGQHQNPKVSIAMGSVLHKAFLERGLIPMETFRESETGEIPLGAPAYKKLHYVFLDLNLLPEEFQVGPDV